MGNAFNANFPMWLFSAIVTETELFGMAQRSQWDALQLRCESHSHEASWSDRCGNTALHIACRKQPRVDVLLSLIRACHDTLSMQTVDGMTPLHLACYCGASYDCISLLLNANRQMLSVRDKRGRTALHCVCIGMKTPDTNNIIKEILNRSPELCYSVDNNGRSPLFLVLDDYADAIEEQVRIMTRNANNEANSKVIEEHLFDLDESWVSVSLLLKAAYKQTANGSKPNMVPFKLIHVCAGAAQACPKRFLFLALRLWSEQLKEKDSDGNLPLHIAAFVTSKGKHRQFNSLVKLLSMYPEAARIPDKNGQLPLKLAVESGKKWNEGVRELIEAYPEALATLNVNFNYHPEILALAGKSFSLKTFYQIIRSKPEVLSC